YFNSYSLLTYRLVYYTIWCQVLDIIQADEHLTPSGLERLLTCELMKLGVNDKLQAAFPNLLSIPLSAYKPQLDTMTLAWLSGFANTDGSFSPGLSESPHYTTGYSVAPLIHFGNTLKSELVLHQIISFLGMGAFYVDPETNFGYINITGIDRVKEFISVFGDTPIYGAKAFDYQDFCKIVGIVASKGHLTDSGLKRII
ncbi:homing endonuclease, partial [Laetiporus sulphureus 93-53]